MPDRRDIEDEGSLTSLRGFALWVAQAYTAALPLPEPGCKNARRTYDQWKPSSMASRKEELLN
jgi:hypothetical protein